MRRDTTPEQVLVYNIDNIGEGTEGALPVAQIVVRVDEVEWEDPPEQPPEQPVMQLNWTVSLN